MTAEVRQRFQELKKNDVAVEQNEQIRWKILKKKKQNISKKYFNKNY